MSEIEDYFAGNQQAAQTGMVAALDDDPEQAARSVTLADASGVPATAIYGDVDGFERQHKAQLGSEIISQNQHIADYLNSHPMAPRISHDDLGQLDTASRAIQSVGSQSSFQAWLKSDSMSRSFMEGFGQEAIGQSAFHRPEDYETALRHPLAGALAASVATPMEVLSRVTGGLIHLGHDGMAQVFGDKFANEAAAMAEWAMMRGDMHGAPTPTPNAVLRTSIESAIAGKPLQFVKQLSDVIEATKPYTDAGKEPPIGVHPLIDQAKTLQAKTDGKAIADALSESVKSATRDRAPDFYANFARGHVGDREIGISADAIRDLYGDKQPITDDGKLGWVPDLADKLANAEATGGDVRVPLADWLAKVDPDVAKELHDHLRVQPDGVTLAEAKNLQEQQVQLIKSDDFREYGTEREGEDDNRSVLDQTESLYKFKAGDNTGSMIIEPQEEGKHLHIRWIGAGDDGQGSPNLLGPKAIISLRKALIKEFPDAKTIGGERISGARTAFGGNEGLGVRISLKSKSTLGPLPEPLPLVRGSASLEPLFSVGDRKLSLERRESKPQPGMPEDYKPSTFKMVDENGSSVGVLDISELRGGKDLHVDNIIGVNGHDTNSFGPALTRDVARQLKTEFPNAERIGGFRVSGAREKAGTEREVWMKFEDLADPTKWPALHSDWKEIQRGVQGKPIEMTPEKQKVVDAVNSVLDRIAPKEVGVEGFERIEAPEYGGSKGGVYTRYEDALPWISWSLESPDSVATARHEAIHHLRNAGFFKEGEWDTLSRAARDGEWIKQHRIEERYGKYGLSNAEKLEESIADAYKEWASGKEAPNSTIHAIFERVKEILESIHIKLKEAFGKDLSADEIFQKVESGEVGSRESKGTGEAGTKFETGDIPDIGGKEAETLRDRITKLSGELSVLKSQGFDIKADPRSAELKEARESLRSITSGTFGMTADQYAHYMKLIEQRHTEDLTAANKSALEHQRKTQTKEWKAARTDMRDQVREEIESRPDVALDQMLSQEKIKFHPDALSEQQRAMLPKEFLQKKDGINPDDVAGYFGYHSGDAMVERLGMLTADRKAAGMSAREWSNHLIDTETDRRMEQEHGNLNQSILDEAKDQAISETQLNLLHEEVLHLGLMAKSEFPISKTQLRAWNKEVFDRTPIGSISTDEYLHVAGKAGRAAEMSLLKEDFADAFREKQRQNNAMIMANFAKQYEKSRRSFDRTAKTFRKREVPSVPQEWTNWIHDILQRTGNRVNRSVQDLAENIARQPEKTLTDFAEAKEAETFGLRETPIADFLLDPQFRTEMDKLTADQFAGLKQTINVLAKQGRDEKKIIVAGEAADRDVVLREMREKLGTFPTKALPDEAPRMTALLKVPRMFMAGMTNIETLLNRWDRADPRGIFNRYVSYPMAKAANYKSALEREYAKAYGELGAIKDGDKFVDAPFADPLSRSEANPDGRPWPGFTRKHVLAMLQNAGNKSNWKVLARGYSTDPDALMSWLHRNTTKEDWDRAQKMGDSVFHSLVDKADTVYENLTGATIQKIPLEPVETPFGTYPGWYHPLMADPLRKEVWVKDADSGQWQRNATGRRGSVMDDSDYFHASTANGYTKRRTGAVYPLDLNFDMVPSRIKQMIHDIAFRDVVIQTEKIFGNKAFQAEVTKHYGETYTDLLMPYLKSMAGAESIPSKAGAKAAQISEYFRQNTISTYIGLNPYTALKHGPTAAVMSMREVGGKDFLTAVRSLYGQSPELGLSNSAFAMKHSEELQRRERHWQDTIAGEHKEIEGASTLREKVIEKGSWLVAQSDMLSAKPTWVAKYNTAIADGLSHGESVDLADRAVRRAHGSTAQTNQPSMVRGGGPLHGWLTSVYGFFGTAMQRRIEIAHTLNDTYQLGKEGEIKAAAGNIPKLASDILTYVIWPTAVEEWVTGLTTDDKRGWGAHLLSGATMGVASSVLYLRDLVHAFTTGHDPGVGLLSSPLHDVANVVRDARRGREAFNREHAGKTVSDVLTVFGEATGMAPKTIGSAARFGIDLVNKQQHPRGAAEYFRGITHGTAKKREEK